MDIADYDSDISSKIYYKDSCGVLVDSGITVSLVHPIDITVDGIISEDEKEDFERIKSELNQISIAVNSLSLWVEEAIIDGKIK